MTVRDGMRSSSDSPPDTIVTLVPVASDLVREHFDERAATYDASVMHLAEAVADWLERVYDTDRVLNRVDLRTQALIARSCRGGVSRGRAQWCP